MNKYILFLSLIMFFQPQCSHAKASMSVEFLNSGKVLPADLPFSEAVRVNNLLFLSGQIGLLPGTKTLAKGGIKGETKQAMDNIKTILEIHGYTMKNIVKCTVMLKDIKEWAAFNSIYKTYFTGQYPARSAFGASGLGFNARLEIECIAAVK